MLNELDTQRYALKVHLEEANMMSEQIINGQEIGQFNWPSSMVQLFDSYNQLLAERDLKLNSYSENTQAATSRRTRRPWRRTHNFLSSNVEVRSQGQRESVGIHQSQRQQSKPTEKPLYLPLEELVNDRNAIVLHLKSVLLQSSCKLPIVMQRAVLGILQELESVPHSIFSGESDRLKDHIRPLIRRL